MLQPVTWKKDFEWPAGRRSDKNIDIDAGSLGFDYPSGEMGYSVANGLLPLRWLFEAVLSKRYVAEMDLATRDTLQGEGSIPLTETLRSLRHWADLSYYDITSVQSHVTIK